MKSSIFITLLLTFHFCFSQTEKKEIKNHTCITIGPSASLTARLSVTNFASKSVVYRVQNIPPLNVICDFRSSTRFTIGIALHYEEFKFYRPLVSNNGIGITNNNNLYTYGKFSEFAFTSNHMNVGLRLLLHSNKNDNDFYGGLRLSYDYYSKILFSRTINKTPFGIQILGGYRKFVGRIGFNIEGGIGNPYWCLTGINIKLDE
jgi:hypothetical protein